MKKKGSLELGINTIVVLVIAMVLIAGGITFINGFLKGGTAELEKGFKVTDFSIQPSNDKPLVFAEGDSFSLKAGDQKTIKIGIFNDLPGDATYTLNFQECSSSATYTGASSTTHPVPLVTSLAQKLKPGESKVFNVFISGKATNPATSDPYNKESHNDWFGNLKPGSYLCMLSANATQGTVKSYLTKDVVIEVYN